MALYTCSIFSKVLGSAVNYYAALPFGTAANAFVPTLADVYERKEYPVLYLLHGAFDDGACWIKNTGVVRYAEEAGIALVIPSCGNNFYTDMAHGLPWFTFITQELPLQVRTVFPISGKREETYIAGLSMGGYGAMKAALSRPDLYSAVGVMSGVLVIENTFQNTLPGIFPADIFGDLAQVSGSKHDLFTLVEKRAESGDMPRIYHACGTEDFLYADNIKFRDTVSAYGGIEYLYAESGGGHEWNFWDKHIQEIIKWLRGNGNEVS